MKKVDFNGLIQAEIVFDSELIVSEDLKVLPDAVNLDDVASADFINYQLHLVTLTGLEVVSIRSTSYANNDLAVTVKFGAEEFILDYNDNFSSPLVTFLDKLSPGDFIDVDGAPLGWNNSPVIHIYRVRDIKPSGENEELADFYEIFTDIFELEIDTEEVRDEAGKTLDLPNKSLNGFDIVWTAISGEEFIDLETGEIMMPEETTVLVLEGTIVKNDASIATQFEIRLWVKSVYGEDIVLDLENLGIPGTGYDGGAEKPATVNGIEFVTTYTMVSGDEIQGQANNMRIWNNDSLGNINRIVVELRSPSDHELHVGTEAKPTENAVTTEVDGNIYTYDIEGDFDYFELHNLGGAMYIKTITIFHDAN